MSVLVFVIRIGTVATKTKTSGRPRGRKNKDYAITREDIISRVSSRLLEPDGATASERALSRAAGVSMPTLRHYFASREALIAAVFAHARRGALGHLHEIAAGPLPALRESVRWTLEFIVEGLMRFDLAGLHAVGLQVGLRQPALGPAYLADVLEPTLVAVEARLERHAARGELRVTSGRAAALDLVSPALLAVLHQRELGGATCRPLDLPCFLDAHADAFVRGWST